VIHGNRPVTPPPPPLPQLYYDIAYEQWDAWEARRKAWWKERWNGPDRGVRPDRKPDIWREIAFIIDMIAMWREIATPHGSASRYIVA
jgi:hypothetical protein